MYALLDANRNKLGREAYFSNNQLANWVNSGMPFGETGLKTYGKSGR